MVRTKLTDVEVAVMCGLIVVLVCLLAGLVP